MLTMPTTLKDVDRPTREFAYLRSELLESINKHASPSEVMHVRVETAEILRCWMRQRSAK